MRKLIFHLLLALSNTLWGSDQPADSSILFLSEISDSTTLLDLEFINSKNGKTMAINPNKSYSFDYDFGEAWSDSQTNVQASGYFYSINSEQIILKVDYLYRSTYIEGVSEKSDYLELYDSFIFDTLNINKLSSFRFRHYDVNFAELSGSLLMGLGVIHAIIGSPLASIDYQKNEFNFSTYKRMLLYSGIAFVSGGIVSSIGYNRGQFLLLNEACDRCKSHWRIQMRKASTVE